MKRKKIVTWTVASVLVTIIAFVACQKNPLQEGKDKPKGMNARDGDNCYDGVSTACNGELLYFTDSAQFVDVYNCLETAYDSWNDDFDSTYFNASLPDSMLDHIADSLGFDEEQPLIDFESNLSFNSFRYNMRYLEDLWMNSSSTLDSASDPDIENPFDDPILETMMSKYGEVQIGNSIYKFYADGSSVQITDANCQTLDSIREDSSYASRCPNVIKTPSPGRTESCTWYKKDYRWCQYSSSPPDRKVKCVHHFRIYPWGSYDKGKTKSYKKKSNGKWKRYTIYLELDVHGTKCNDINTQYSNHKQGYRKTLRCRYPGGANIEFFRIRNDSSWTKHKFQDDNQGDVVWIHLVW